MSLSCERVEFTWWQNVVKMDGLKEHPIVLRNAVFFLEITLHLLSTYLFIFYILLLDNCFFSYVLIVLSIILNDIMLDVNVDCVVDLKIRQVSIKAHHYRMR